MSGTMNWRERMMLRKLAEQPSALDLPLRVTFFQDRFAAAKTERQISLRDLVPLIRDTQAPYKAQLPWLKLAAFGDHRGNGGSLRNDANVLEVWGAEADYDGESLTLDHARQVLTNAGVAALLYTSPSHRPEAPRWRVLCPTASAVQPEARAALVARINGLFVGALAQESFTLSQSYYYGSVPGAAHEVALVEGKAIDLCDHLDEGAVGKAHKPAATPQDAAQPALPALAYRGTQNAGGSPLGRQALGEWCDKIRSAWDGSKHHAINEAAFAVGGLVTKRHLEEAEAWGALRDALGAILDRCKDKRAAERTLRRAFVEGMGRPQDVEPPPPPEEVHPAAPFLAKLAAKWAERQAKAAREQAAPIPVAVDILQPGGTLQLLMDACVRSALRPQPFLSLGAAICAVGALAGRRYRTSTDLRTNIYVAAVAESGAGKDHAPEIIRRCFDAAGLERYLGGETIASGRAVLSSLEQHPARLFQVDEMGKFLLTVTGKKAAIHKEEIWTELMKLYSRAKGIYRGTEYANKKENPRIDIHQPCACFYGTTTPSTFWAALEGGAMADGSLARFLTFITDNNRPPRNRGAGIFVPDEDLLEALRAIPRGQGDPLPAGNLPGGVFTPPMLATEPADPYTVPMSPEAERFHEAKQEEEDAWARQVEGTPQAAIVNRLGENAAKLALISAISRDPTHPVISARDAAWAWAVAEHCTRSLLKDADRFIADSEFEVRLNKAVNIIGKHGPCTKRDLFLKGLKLSDREFKDVIDALVGNGVLVAIPTVHTGAGRPTVRFTLAPKGEQAEPEEGSTE